MIIGSAVTVICLFPCKTAWEEAQYFRVSTLNLFGHCKNAFVNVKVKLVLCSSSTTSLYCLLLTVCLT